mgnify:FL=1
MIVSEYNSMNNKGQNSHSEKEWFPVSGVSSKRLMTYLAVIRDRLAESSLSHIGFDDICYSFRRKMPVLDISVGIYAHSADEAVRVIDSVISSGSASDGTVYCEGFGNEEITAELEKWRKGEKLTGAECGMNLVELPFYPADNMIYRPDSIVQSRRRKYGSSHRQLSGRSVYGIDRGRSFYDGTVNIFEVLDIMGDVLFRYRTSDEACIGSVRFAAPTAFVNAEHFETEISEHDIRVYFAEGSTKNLFAEAEFCNADEITDGAEISYIADETLHSDSEVPVSISVHDAVRKFVRAQAPSVSGFAVAYVESCIIYDEISAADEKNIHIGLVKRVSDSKYVIDLRISDGYGSTLMNIKRMYLICKR